MTFAEAPRHRGHVRADLDRSNRSGTVVGRGFPARLITRWSASAANAAVRRQIGQLSRKLLAEFRRKPQPPDWVVEGVEFELSGDFLNGQ
jgi:hypothetical protein